MDESKKIKIMAFNGSARRKSTSILLNKALEGAQSCGAEVEMVDLYSLNFKGCKGCYSCKVQDGPSYGKCACKDDLTPVLERALQADGLIFGSPIYFECVTGEMRSFIERLMYPCMEYSDGFPSILKKQIPCRFVYTMNVDEEFMKEAGYTKIFDFLETTLSRVIGPCESMAVNDTFPVENFKKHGITVFDEEHKKAVKETLFPKDCEKAYNMGAELVKSLN